MLITVLLAIVFIAALWTGTVVRGPQFKARFDRLAILTLATIGAYYWFGDLPQLPYVVAYILCAAVSGVLAGSCCSKYWPLKF